MKVIFSHCYKIEMLWFQKEPATAIISRVEWRCLVRKLKNRIRSKPFRNHMLGKESESEHIKRYLEKALCFSLLYASYITCEGRDICMRCNKIYKIDYFFSNISKCETCHEIENIESTVELSNVGSGFTI